MADSKISALTGGGAPTAADEIPSERSAANVKLTLSNWPGVSGGTDVAVADGGTGSSTAAAARTALGVAGLETIPWEKSVMSAGTLEFMTSGNPGANWALAHRCVAPRSGTLSAIAVYQGTVSGNIDVGVYSISADARTRLWSLGSTAMAGANQWKTLGNPGLTVVEGDLLDFIVSVDNGTATIGRVLNIYNAIQVQQLPSGFPTNGTLFCWGIASSFPLPASFAAVGSNNANTRWIILGLVT